MASKAGMKALQNTYQTQTAHSGVADGYLHLICLLL
jgi:hypothetical protein